MIYSRDSHGKYWYQLTQPELTIGGLEFALERFRGNIFRNCVVKKHLDTEEFAVFTDGLKTEAPKGSADPMYCTIQISSEVHYEV